MLEVVGERVGLSFDNDKAQLLIPKGWDLPENEALPGLQIRSDTLPEIRLQGIEIVGSPIGSSYFREQFVKDTLRDTLKKSADLTLLHAQSATKLLLNCVVPAPCYIAQVCHPDITKEPLTDFDDHIWKLWTQILGGGEELDLCPTGLSRAQRLGLPSNPLWRHRPS